MHINRSILSWFSPRELSMWHRTIPRRYYCTVFSTYVYLDSLADREIEMNVSFTTPILPDSYLCNAITESRSRLLPKSTDNSILYFLLKNEKTSLRTPNLP